MFSSHLTKLVDLDLGIKPIRYSDSIDVKAINDCGICEEIKITTYILLNTSTLRILHFTFENQSLPAACKH